MSLTQTHSDVNNVTSIANELVFLTQHTGKDEATLLNEALQLGLALLHKQTVAQSTLKTPMRVKDLNAFFASLPPLGEDIDLFSKDIESIRDDLSTEVNPWA